MKEVIKNIKIKDILQVKEDLNLIDLGVVEDFKVEGRKGSLVINVGGLGIGKDEVKVLEERCKKEIGRELKLDVINVIFTAGEPMKSKMVGGESGNLKGGQKNLKEEGKNSEVRQEGGSSQEVKPIKGVKKVIAVASAKGGVGKSTVSVNLALSLKKIGFKVGLVDADIYGPSIPHMMNLKGKPKVEDNLMIPMNSYGIDCISIGTVIDNDQALVWRGPMITKTLYQLIRGVKWEDIDYLIIDLPPGTGDIYLSLAQQFPVDGAVIVSTPQDISVIDTVKSVDMFQKLDVPIIGVVQNMAYLVDEKTGKKTYLFGQDGAKKMAKKMKINFLGDIPLDIKIREAGDGKKPIVAKDPSSQTSFLYGGVVENIIDYEK